MAEPFWPRRSPHFLACRQAVRSWERSAIIGLSGGPDSLALVSAAAAEGKDVRAVVVDHGLQEGSADVAKRACDQARALGVPAEVVAVSIDVAPGQSIEAVAREARYRALADAAEHSGVHDIWVGHTRDDQAETLLLGALRGNPSGMGPVADVPIGAGESEATEDLRLVRPLLGVRRADTAGACAELGLDYWDDPMNADSAYRRVAVRQEIIPQLSELIGGDCVPALAQTADRIAADARMLDLLIDGAPSNDCVELAGESGPVRRRRILAWLRSQGLAVSGVQLAAVEKLCTDWRGQGPVDVGDGVRVGRVDKQLRVM